jgi:alpha-galactosidase
MNYLVVSIIFGVLNSLMGGSVQGQRSLSGVYQGKPHINEPFVTGNYPNTPFLFAVPTSGERPVYWSSRNLPAGLHIDSSTGFITGVVKDKGDYVVWVSAENRLGRTTKELMIKIGNLLALTPPMGWNSWNTFATGLSDSLVRQTADSMVSSGMRDLGYQYINIDDFWQLKDRDSSGNIQINKIKFPNGIKTVADYVHSKGLKLGIYSDAAAHTCGGVAGSYLYEEKDAKAFGDWQVDLLKYDYCEAPDARDTAVDRYTRMARALHNQPRSIVYSVCEWGAYGRKPWTWAAGIGGNYWRTTWDIRNTWKLEYDNHHAGIMDILDVNAKLAQFAGPGHWNDPDMLVVGISDDPNAVVTVNGARVCTEEEQRSHMSLWALMSAPLLCGNDIRSMNDVTKEILLNSEIIAVNQDALGKPAMRIRDSGDLEVFARPLADGSWAVGLLNRSEKSVSMKISWEDLGIGGSWNIRDLWKHKDLGRQSKELEVLVPVHGCRVLRISK